MNAKRCVYKNCGTTSALSQKITFFSFPLKDSVKCRTWAQMAGYEDTNLKNKYLCENHFSTVYISKTPRRTVLLPNAVPYHYSADNQSADENYEDDYNSEKNTSREEIILDHLDDEESDIVYTDAIVVRHKEEEEADVGNVENVESLDEALEEEHLNIKPNIKLNPVKIVPKSYDRPIEERAKKLDTIANKRASMVVGDVNHVTKRQKLHTSADDIIVTNHKNESLKTTEKPDTGDAKLDEQNLDQLDNTIDNPDITTFIYKGEEYIQMPKRIYLQQRAKLDTDVKRFQNIVQNIKSLVNSTD